MAKRNGSALISALFIVTLVAIATTAMSVRLQQDIYRLRLSATVDKLYLASQSVTFWAMNLLNKNPLPTAPAEYLFPKSRSQDYPGIILSGEVIDLQSKFNINQLIDTESDEANQLMMTSFFQLLNMVLEESGASNHRELVLATKAWVNERVKEKGIDDNTAYYQQQKPPYSPSYQPMQSISEFRLIRGVDEKTYQALLPYITALPPPVAININTAPVPVLMLLGEGIEKHDAEKIVEMRGPEGFKSIEQINELLNHYKIHADQITLESDYFLCKVIANSDGLEIIHYTILKRAKAENGKRVTHIVHDSLNEL